MRRFIFIALMGLVAAFLTGATYINGVNQIPDFTGTAISSATLTTTGNGSIGGNLDVVGTLSAANFNLDSGGLVGIGTASPKTTIDIGGLLGTYNAAYRLVNIGGASLSGFNVGEDADNRAFCLWDNVSNYWYMGTREAAVSYASTLVLRTGNVGMGVVDPDTALEVFKAGNQLKLSFDGTDNTTFGVDTSGNLTITPSGTQVIMAKALKATDYYSGDGTQGITDSTSYWLCTAADCSTKCQVSIKDGLVVGCT